MGSKRTKVTDINNLVDRPERSDTSEYIKDEIKVQYLYDRTKRQ